MINRIGQINSPEKRSLTFPYDGVFTNRAIDKYFLVRKSSNIVIAEFRQLYSPFPRKR